MTVEVEDVGAGTGWSIEASEAAPAATAHCSEAAGCPLCRKKKNRKHARRKKDRKPLCIL